MAAELGITTDELRRRVNLAGKTVGKPWAQDQKEAMAAAWLALGAKT